MKSNPISQQISQRMMDSVAKQESLKKLAERRKKRDLEYKTRVPWFPMETVCELCRRARKGNEVATALAWHGASEFAETILQIARSDPKRLIKLAASSLYLPALLSRSKSFNNGVAQLPEELNLSADLAGRYGAGARFESPKTRLVIEFYERKERNRPAIQHFARLYEKKEDLQRNFPKLEDYLIEEMAFDSEDLRLVKLGALSPSTVGDWWEQVFRPWLEDEETLISLRGTKLYDELARASKKTRKGDRKLKSEEDILKHRCKEALKTLANSRASKLSKPPALPGANFSHGG